MLRLNSAGLAGAGLVFLLLVGEEIRGFLPWFDVTPPADAPAPNSEQHFSIEATHGSEPPMDTDSVLARPLFNWNRRPGVSGISPGFAESLPRLSGIVIDADKRYAIFAAVSAGSKPMIVQEGGMIGRYMIDRIAPDHVDVRFDGGLRSLRTSFDSPPAATLKLPDAS
jgi:hypothetical protein